VPQRKRIVTVPSDEVQGEGSVVTVARFTVGEWEDFQKRAGEEGADMWALEAEALATHLVAWNWVDDQGVPLLMPDADNLDRSKLLTRDETQFLVNAILGQVGEQETKNSDSN
jgi:hypothetical protein